jgi:Do/DeqQ family serine protease
MPRIPQSQVRKFPVRKSLAALAVASLVTGSALLFTAGSHPSQASAPVFEDQRGVLTIAPLLEKVTPGVVNIAVKTQKKVGPNPLLSDPFFRQFFGQAPQLQEPREREGMSAGSGVIVDAAKGYVLTNNHVIDDAKHIQVTLKDGREFKAKLIGTDPDTDIALLQIKADNLTAVPFGRSESVRVGDVVIAIGNPFALGQTVTSGIVSALGRSGLGIEGYEDFIQTDASINPGNSGGALINSKGELIGINTAIIGPGGGNVGIGFAVPSHMAKSVMTQLAEFGEVRRGRLGVVIQDLTPDIADALGIEAANGGAIVTDVDGRSPAAKAGLKAGDVIVALDGKPVRNSADLRNRVGMVQKGERVALDMLREGKAMTKTVEVGAMTTAELPGAKITPELAGAVFRDMPASHGSAHQGPERGIIVAKAAEGSPAWRYGLREGDLIAAVNRKSVPSLEDFASAVKSAGPVIAMNLVRDGGGLFIVIQR